MIPPPPPGAPPDLRRLAEEEGWKVLRSQEDRWVIELDSEGRLPVAHLDPRGAKIGFKVWVEAHRYESLARESTQALDVFLTRLNRSLHGCTAKRISEDDATVVRVEATGPPHPDASEIDRALRACAFATRQSRGELNALEDEHCVRAYRTLSGLS